MTPVFSPAGKAALQRAVTEHALVAFDYDGTLAPITEHYEDTHTPSAIVQSLEKLTQLATVAIITGRSVADVSKRLGFTPHAIVGNHGAEGLSAFETARHITLVTRWRLMMEEKFSGSFHDAGVILEDKGSSLSLHYRQASNAATAKELITQACAVAGSEARIIGGKCVVNIVPADALDKADALLEVMHAHGKTAAIFVGDDENDEVVFQRAPATWLTVRVGQHDTSAAPYYLENQQEIAHFIDAMLTLSRAD